MLLLKMATFISYSTLSLRRIHHYWSAIENRRPQVLFHRRPPEFSLQTPRFSTDTPRFSSETHIFSQETMGFPVKIWGFPMINQGVFDEMVVEVSDSALFFQGNCKMLLMYSTFYSTLHYKKNGPSLRDLRVQCTLNNEKTCLCE